MSHPRQQANPKSHFEFGLLPPFCSKIRDQEKTMFKFQAKIRIAGRVSYVSVQASDSAHARLLVRAQYGEQVTILQTKRYR